MPKDKDSENTIELESGAKLTLNDDGSFTYEPNPDHIVPVRLSDEFQGFTYTMDDGFNTVVNTQKSDQPARPSDPAGFKMQGEAKEATKQEESSPKAGRKKTM